MVIWSISAFMTLSGLVEVLPWFRLMAAAPIAMMLAIFYFIQTLFGLRRKWSVLALLYGIAAIILCGFTNYIIQSANLDLAGILHYQFSPFIGFVAGPGYVLIIISIVELIRGYNHTSDANQRNRIRYLIIGLSITILASSINFTKLGKYPIDVAANGVTAILIAYAIMRHNLLDINVVIRKSLLYSIPTILIGAGYFLIISLASRIFHTNYGFGIFAISLIVAILAALVAQPLRDRAQSWIDRSFFREKYNASLMLQGLSSKVASILDLTEITNIILEEITSTLHIDKAAFFLKRDGNNDLFMITQKGIKTDTTIRMSASHPIVVWFSNQERVLTRNDLGLTPQFKALWGRERDDLEKLNAELFIPLKVKRELVGIFTVGSKRSEESFSIDDQLTLTTLANQTAVAIENARLYTAEQRRREELDTLYDMARQLVATDDMEIVLNSITRHAVESIHVTYARLLTLDENGSFRCRAVYPIRDSGHLLGVGRNEPASTHGYYKQAFNLSEALILERDNPAYNENERRDLFLGLAKSLCISPLKVVDEPIGILVLGEARNTSRESFDPDKLQLVTVISDQAASALRRTSLHEQLEEGFVQTVLALANAVDARDTYVENHSQRMAGVAEVICRELNFNEDQIQAVHWAALLHDIGKIGVPDEILSKPGPLNNEEWAIMMRHPEIGSQILAPVKRMSYVAPIIRAHHEKYDGSGYPDGLKGSEIPLGARILAVVDAYIAIKDERVYRKSRSHAEAILEIKRYSGTQFDPQIVDIFMKVADVIK
jgi:putative nucleotidyltransferase with HDIG domain